MGSNSKSASQFIIKNTLPYLLEKDKIKASVVFSVFGYAHPLTANNSSLLLIT